MKAIYTEFKGPTDTLPARMVAYDSDRSDRVVMELPNGIWGADKPHELAAKAYLKKVGWRGRWVGGFASADNRMVWVSWEDSPIVTGE